MAVEAITIEAGQDKSLRLSHATTHQYVTELYRHFAVWSRAQLMAYVLKRIVGDNVRVV